MIKSDEWIHVRSKGGMIHPYVADSIRKVDNSPIISYGPSSYGYDLRLGADFRVFRHIPGTVVDPKDFNPANLEKAELHEDEKGEYFILPAHSYALGVTMERVEMPENVTGLLLNKSTYVRCATLLPTTVIEAGWAGYITLEISNSSPADTRVYYGEGIAQLLFFEGEPCCVSYATRKGKYQDQGEQVTLAKV